MKIHKEGKRIVSITIFGTLILGIGIFFLINYLFDNSTVGAIVLGSIYAGLLVLVFIIVRFFRSPLRRPSVDDINTILSPCDGKVVIIQEVEEPEFLKEKVMQVSIFMSVFNVHVNWFPIKGDTIYYKYHPGKYLVAWHPKSSTLNERTSVAMSTASGKKILFRQIAGLVAKRIVCYAKKGTAVNAGDEVGFIKFGSRIDIFLPLDSEILVKNGEKVKGCLSKIAKLRE